MSPTFASNLDTNDGQAIHSAIGVHFDFPKPSIIFRDILPLLADHTSQIASPSVSASLS